VEDGGWIGPCGRVVGCSWFVVGCLLDGARASVPRLFDSSPQPARRSGTDEAIAGARATRPGGAHSPSPRFLDSPAPRPRPDAATAAAASTGLLQPHRLDSSPQRHADPGLMRRSPEPVPHGLAVRTPRFLDSPAPRPGPDAATAAAASTGLLQPHRLDSSTQRHAVPGLMERRSGPKPLGLPPNPQRPNTLTTPAECSRDRRGGNPSSPRPSRRRCGACASGR